MRNTRRARVAWVCPVVALAASSTLAGCGADDVRSNAAKTAHGILRINLATAIECLEDVAPGLQADLDSAELADTLTPCGATTFFNHDDDAIRTVDPLASKRGTIVVGSDTSGDHLTLELVTSGAGLSEAGVSRARSLVATCWQVMIDLRSRTLGEPTSSDCNDAVIERKNPSEVVPFAEVSPDSTN